MSIAITGLWLRRGDKDNAEVLIEVNGAWHCVLNEYLEGPFSHIIEPLGMHNIVYSIDNSVAIEEV